MTWYHEFRIEDSGIFGLCCDYLIIYCTRYPPQCFNLWFYYAKLQSSTSEVCTLQPLCPATWISYAQTRLALVQRHVFPTVHPITSTLTTGPACGLWCGTSRTIPTAWKIVWPRRLPHIERISRWIAVVVVWSPSSRSRRRFSRPQSFELLIVGT